MEQATCSQRRREKLVSALDIAVLEDDAEAWAEAADMFLNPGPE